MKLLNIGCGSIFHPAWINLDLDAIDPAIQVWDLRKGLPQETGTIDACYSSHVIEHLIEAEAHQLLSECWRVLRPGGILRVVVPDLEQIARTYLTSLEAVEAGNSTAEANYDWMMLELFDQVNRQTRGGKMQDYLAQPHLTNKDFIASRIGWEAETFWAKQSNQNQLTLWEKIKTKSLAQLFQFARVQLAMGLVQLVAGTAARKASQEGLFRQSGEIHRWMYDRFSLARLLKQIGFQDIQICRADESQIPDFNHYGLDIWEGNVRKPDSLFMEARKL